MQCFANVSVIFCIVQYQSSYFESARLNNQVSLFKPHLCILLFQESKMHALFGLISSCQLDRVVAWEFGWSRL